MTEQNKKLVIFDFDGVLVNTVDFWYKMHKDLNGDLTWEFFKKMSDGNWIHTAEKMKNELTNYIWPKNSEEKYHSELQNVFSIEDILHDLVLDLVDKHLVAIVSSESSKIINDFLIKENLDGCFVDVYGCDVHTSKVVKINQLLDKHNLNTNDAIFITDTLGDIKEANECKVNTIAVTWGVHEKERLEKGNPYKIIDNPGELEGVINEYFEFKN